MSRVLNGCKLSKHFGRTEFSEDSEVPKKVKSKLFCSYISVYPNGKTYGIGLDMCVRATRISQ